MSVLARDGIWTWFNSPVAFYDSTADSLVFGAYPKAFQRPLIGAFNCTTRADLQYGILEGAAAYETDDHDNPAVYLLASGKYLACFSEHNDDSLSYTSTAANSARLWDAGVSMNTASQDAYCQILQATYSNKIYCFHRRFITTEYPQYFRTSTDDGATWSSSTQFLQDSGDRPYFRWWRTSGTRFDFVYTNGQPSEAVCSLYHGYMTIDASTGAHAYYKSDGTLVGDDADLPFTSADFTLVYDGTTSEGWIWDLKYINGQPTVVFAVFPSHGTDSHEYHYGRFNGTSWSTAKICDAGTTAAEDWLYSVEVNYSGGICLDPTNENIVYLSREYGATDFRVETWTNSSGWSKTADLSGNTSSVNARPVAVDCDGTTNILWWEGTYTSFTSYDTDLRIYPAVNFRTEKAMSGTPLPALSPVGSRLFLPLTEGTGTPADLTATYTPSVTGSLTWGTTSGFGAYSGPFSTSNYITFNSLATDFSGASAARWMAVMFENTDTTASQYLVAVGRSSTTTPFWGIAINNGATGTLAASIRNDASLTRHTTAASQPLNDGNRHVAMCVSFTSGNPRQRLYLDGVQVGTSDATVGAITLDRAAVGCLLRTTAANPFLGKIYAVAIGWGSVPHPEALYDDWINGRFSGLGTDAAAASGLLLSNAAYFARQM
jgi:hypothetical protein